MALVEKRFTSAVSRFTFNKSEVPTFLRKILKNVMMNN